MVNAMSYRSRVGVFLKDRIATPTPLQRQFGPEILQGKAPQESAPAKDALPACPVLYGSGQGAVNKLVRFFMMRPF